MAKVCQICQKSSKKSYSRSHSNIATKRRQHVNLQTALVDGKRVPACSRCIKNLYKKN